MIAAITNFNGEAYEREIEDLELEISRLLTWKNDLEEELGGTDNRILPTFRKSRR